MILGFRKELRIGMKISIVNFSGRNDGNCHGVLKLIEEYYVKEHELKLMEMSNLNIMPCTKCHYECFHLGQMCPYKSDDVQRIYDTIAESDLAYYIIPNYNEYPNALYFIFNERGQGHFQNKKLCLSNYLAIKKKFIVVSNTQQDHFRQAMRNHITSKEEVEILFLASKEFRCSSIEGNLMFIDAAKKIIHDFLI